MNSTKKPALSLTIDDFRKFPVWRYTNCDDDETMMTPVESLPVSNLRGCIVGTQLTLNNGTRIWGTLGNIDINNAFKTSQFLSLTIFREGSVFHLANYFEVGFEERCPMCLAKFLDLPLEDVFPIQYDISDIAEGQKDILVSTIQAEPRQKLSDKELMTLAVRGTLK